MANKKKIKKENEMLRQRLQFMKNQQIALLEQDIVNQQYAVGYYGVIKPKIDNILKEVGNAKT